LSYTALTAFCRRQGIGQTPLVPAGQYHFDPGEELQHDTSPHEVEVSGKKYHAQTASAVLCYSRMLFFQIYPAFQRFDCKVFLTDALRYMGGSPARVMIDNTHVVVLRGTGSDMVPVPEMEAFAERFGFRFVAHERGDANRSARVERPLSAQFLVMYSKPPPRAYPWGLRGRLLCIIFVRLSACQHGYKLVRRTELASP
jgi:transposase